jgi:hypothetical protein
MKKNKTYRYKANKNKNNKSKRKNNKSKRKNNKSKRKQGGSPETEKNILITTGKYKGYLGEVLKENKTIPHGVGRMTYQLPDTTYADYLGKWENGEKNDDAGRFIVNVRKRDISSPQYYLEGNWKDNKKEGFHKLYPIKTVRDETNAYKYNTKNTKEPLKRLYFEDDKPADKKIEDTIKETLDNKKVPDELINNINSYRKR